MSITIGQLAFSGVQPQLSADELEAIFADFDAQGVQVTPDYEGFHERAELLAQTADEMEAQDEKWGQQDHPLRVDPYSPGAHVSGVSPLTAERYADLANQWKAINDVRAANGCLAWDGILLEEVFEALAEEKDATAIVELVQSAGVAIQAAASVQRNGIEGT